MHAFVTSSVSEVELWLFVAPPGRESLIESLSKKPSEYFGLGNWGMTNISLNSHCHWSSFQGQVNLAEKFRILNQYETCCCIFLGEIESRSLQEPPLDAD